MRLFLPLLRLVLYSAHHHLVLIRVLRGDVLSLFLVSFGAFCGFGTGFDGHGQLLLLSDAFFVDHCHTGQTEQFLLILSVGGGREASQGVGLLLLLLGLGGGGWKGAVQ